MEVFLNVILAIHLEPVRAGDNMVSVIVAIVLYVMTECRNDYTQII